MDSIITHCPVARAVRVTLVDVTCPSCDGDGMVETIRGAFVAGCGDCAGTGVVQMPKPAPEYGGREDG